MGRWRQPSPRSSPYITREGYGVLETELRGLWEKRRHVVQALSAAAAEGDRSENAEYIYRKKELREIDRRIGYLQKRMPDLKVITECPAEGTRVFFGAWVTLEDEKGEDTEYRIVGPDEFDPAKHYISVDSPLAQALLKKSVHDEIHVKTPSGGMHCFIVQVRYA